MIEQGSCLRPKGLGQPACFRSFVAKHLRPIAATAIVPSEELHEISACSLAAKGRTVGFPHRVRRRVGNP